MKKSNKARKYSSELLNNLIAEISPLEFQQTKEKMILASRIGQLMAQKGIKKVELAKKLNKRPSEITKWLSGTQNITLDILTMISFALGVEISSLFVKEEKQYNLGATSSFLTSVKEPK
ncbi:MAG: helix-turn-helix transcriptional regulator [Saprospiraceae bacterium]|nr:helix-turn-helix transcriptional regulator [Candidatus Defluviibacterium haderslevense]